MNAQQYERDTVGHLETIMHTCWFLVLGLWFIIRNTNANLNIALTQTRNQELNSHSSATLFLLHLLVGRTGFKSSLCVQLSILVLMLECIY